ncbi:MAG: HAMP domain-containing histidine kinase [Patescibacteria group bacterium]|nr:HAMP domain-containing histidine kinase [Patescibacteria group bacterium]
MYDLINFTTVASQSFHQSLLVWLFSVFSILLVFSFIPSFIRNLKISLPTIEVSQLRLYLASILLLIILASIYWYFDERIVNIPDPVIPFIFYVLFLSSLYNLKVTIPTALFTSIFVIYYCYEPRYFAYVNLSLLSISYTVVGVIASVVSGYIIRSYNHLLITNLGYLRENLVKVGQERSILEHLHQASLALSSSELNLNHVLRIMAEESRRLIGSDTVGILLKTNSQAGSLVNIYHLGKILKTHNQINLFANYLLTVAKQRHNQTFEIRIRDLRIKNLAISYFSGVNRILVAPIATQNKLRGLLFLTNNPRRQYFNSSDHKKLKLFTNYSAFAVDNAQHHEDLKILIKARDQLSSVVAHELKTPLTTIKLCTELLLHNANNVNQKAKFIEKLMTIDQETDKITMLSNSLLDFYRILTGKLVLNLSLFNLAEFCQQKIAIMQSIYPHHQISYQSNLGNLVIRADKLRLDEVLTNLINNAVKYSRPGSSVKVQLANNDQTIQLTVQDRGIGIPPNKAKHIFDAFYQAKNSTSNTQDSAGLGLGLYISKEIISSHHGKIWFESQEKKGTTFFVSLPKGN